MTNKPDKETVTEVLPCPFCGFAKVNVHREHISKIHFSHEYNYWAECDSCNAQSAPEDTHENAIKTWNRRVPVTTNAEKEKTNMICQNCGCLLLEDGTALHCVNPACSKWQGMTNPKAQEITVDMAAAWQKMERSKILTDNSQTIINAEKRIEALSKGIMLFRDDAVRDESQIASLKAELIQSQKENAFYKKHQPMTNILKAMSETTPDELKYWHDKCDRLEAALEFYSDSHRWIECMATNDIDDEIKEGEPMMVFLDGQDTPWKTARNALSPSPQPPVTPKVGAMEKQIAMLESSLAEERKRMDNLIRLKESLPSPKVEEPSDAELLELADEMKAFLEKDYILPLKLAAIMAQYAHVRSAMNSGEKR